MEFLAFLSPYRRERMARRRRRRRLKFLPLLALLGAIVFTVRCLVTFVTFEIPKASVEDVLIPVESTKVESTAHASTETTFSETATLRSINGWQRLKPSHGGTAYGEIDDFSTGKSCRWEPTSFYYPKKLLSWIFFFSRASFLGTWICRDCGLESSVPWQKCPSLRPRGKCSAFEFQGWEEPLPRSASTYDPFSSSPDPIRLITSYGVGKVRRVEYEQPQCLSLRKPCFDMDRCTTPPSTPSGKRQLLQPLPVFAYPGKARKDLEDAIDGKNIVSSDHLEGSAIARTAIRVVDDPQLACLLVSHANDFSGAKESNSWNLGVNHYVYGVAKPISENIHYDMAALGSVAITEAQLRPEYDIPLPLPAIWNIRDLADRKPNFRREIIEDLNRPRKYLLTFKGSIQDTLQPYYQHRWLAAEYMYEEPDVAIDVQCKHKTLWGDTVTFANYDNPSQENFDDLMVNSTFAFCPGGSHVTSYRFTEVLSAGAIPVLLPEIVTPFFPEVDWSSCVIRVSQARIVDLPRVLRAIPPEEIRKRQLQCDQLFRTFLQVRDGETAATKSEVSASDGYLVTALKVWHLRLEKQHHGDQLSSILASSSTNNTGS
jgi:hypothetical protein